MTETTEIYFVVWSRKLCGLPLTSGPGALVLQQCNSTMQRGGVERGRSGTAVTQYGSLRGEVIDRVGRSVTSHPSLTQTSAPRRRQGRGAGPAGAVGD